METHFLKHSKINRGGVTARDLSFETGVCRFDVKKRGLEFQFSIASKGGGDTSILLEIGSDDFPEILSLIARELPETAGIFADCTAIAIKKILENK